MKGATTMTRNMNKDYIRKLIKTETPNGYKFDLANYLYNPSYGYDYPRFKKVIAEDDTTITYNVILYYKFYNGNGEYQSETYKVLKADAKENEWVISRDNTKETLSESRRFNLNTLLSYC